MNILQHLIDAGTKPRYVYRKLEKDAQLMSDVMKSTQFLPLNSSINERVHCIINEVTIQSICQNPTCLNNTTFKGMQSGYHKFCNHTCSAEVTKGRLLTPEAIGKRKATMLERYGVEHNFEKGSKLYDIKQRTIKDHYGVDNVSSNTDIQQRKQQIIRDNNNGKHYSAAVDYKLNKIDTLQQKYGDHVTNYSQTHISPESIRKLHDREFLHYQHHTLQKPLTEIADMLGVSDYAVKLNCDTVGVPTINRIGTSYGELQLQLFLSPYCTVELNSRSVIPPKELDIYIPDHDLAIEYDGVYWHSDCHDRIDKQYHLNKTKMCADKGVQLFHIFENEWKDPVKQDVWKSIISGKLKKNTTVYARKCNIVMLDSKSSNMFLHSNHIQGQDSSSIRLGLEYENELVACMTFGKSRYSKKYDFELIRFCNKKYHSVVGGASRLLTHFKRNHTGSIVSYADKRRSDGNLYNVLGFTHIHDSAPNYFYWHKSTPMLLESRIQYQKHKLSTKLDIFDPDLTEYQNMILNGYNRIWDCGNMVFVKP